MIAVDILFGSFIGFVAMGLVWWVKDHERRTKERVQQEKEYIEVQQLVDTVVTKLERIIYRK
jgi:hypothetical protein